jgi:hypothetical protein
MFSDTTYSTDDEDFTHISEDTLPYLSLCSPPDRAKSATTGKRINNLASGRPQTAPANENSMVHFEDFAPAGSSDTKDEYFFTITHKTLKPQVKKEREIRHVSGTTFRGRVELDLTESGSRLPLRPPTTRQMHLNRRRSKSPADKRPPVQEAFCDKSVPIDMTDDVTVSVNDVLEKKDTDGETSEQTSSSKPPLSMSQFLYNDPDNKQYSADKKTNSLSEADKSALRLGRLVLSTVLNQPEISVPDAISRFFVDTWLAKNGSSITKADGLSVSLMTNLQRAFTEFDPGVDVGAVQAASCQKTVAAVACETLDTLIQAFGDSNPVLYDIRESLLPLIFMHPPDLQLPLRKITAATLAEDTKLSGERYINADTWCEDGAVVVEELRNTENALFVERQKSHQASADAAEVIEKFEKLQNESKNALSIMNHARADLEKSESNYQQLLVSFEEVSGALEAETKKCELESEKYQREHKANTVANVNLSALKAKYDAIVNERKELKENKVKLKNDISVLNSTLASSQKSFEATRKNLETIKANAKDTTQKLAAAEKEREERNTRDKEIIKSMNDFFGGKQNTNLIMSHKIHESLASQPVAITALASWKDELLLTIGHLEEQFKEAADELKKSDDEIMKSMQKEHLQEIQVINAANKKQILEMKDNHKADLVVMEDSLMEHRRDNLDLTLERNSIETEMREAEERHEEMKLLFEEGNSNLVSQLEALSEEHCLMREQMCAVQADHMLEEVLYDTKLTNAGLNEKVFYLVKSIEILKKELEGMYVCMYIYMS